LPNLGKSPEAPANPPGSSPDPSPGRTPPPDPVPAPDWKIPHAIALQYPDHVAIRFDIPVFVSADNISKEGGMDIVNALAAKLRQRKDSLLVTVTGHTDDEQITNPNAKYRTNADLAAARARQVREHLELKSRNSRLAFREEAAPPEAAPYPNDTPANRRLNRTVTLRIEPAP
jgi:flagellar motor protein MotB